MFNDPRKILFRIIGVIIFIGIIIFVYFKYKPYLEGPKIVSINIEPYMTIEEPFRELHGVIENTKSVSINGRDLTLTEKKYFNETVVFGSGLNSIEIQLVDTFGKVTDYTYMVYYQHDESDIIAPTLIQARIDAEQNPLLPDETLDEQELIENNNL